MPSKEDFFKSEKSTWSMMSFKICFLDLGSEVVSNPRSCFGVVDDDDDDESSDRSMLRDMFVLVVVLVWRCFIEVSCLRL